jgi:copper homeostasis protein
VQYKLEICVDSLESAINAQIAGADRVELCDNLVEGGTTPSYGTILSARNNLSIGLDVIIRPRGSDFLYSDQEYDIMRRDIEVCNEAGVDGISIGILQADGTIDVERTSRLIGFARPMSVTFHRAFDLCSDPLKGLEDIISAGANRLLTSGQMDCAANGADLLARLVNKAGDRIIIMPGGGINESNISWIAGISGAKEFHLTGRSIVESEMVFRKPGISMGGIQGIPEFSRKVADEQKIRNIIEILKLI